MTGTIYRAGVTTPAGIRFEATVYVPDDAEYADQHELTELASYGVQRMVTDHERHHRAMQPEAVQVLGVVGEHEPPAEE